MNKRKILALLLGLSLIPSVVACKPKEPIDDPDPIVEDDSAKIARYKKEAKDHLEEQVNPALEVSQNTGISDAIITYYNSEVAYIDSITELSVAEQAKNKVDLDTGNFIINTLKPLAIEKINEVVNPLIASITFEDLRTSVQTFYNTEMNKFSELNTIKGCVEFVSEVIDDTRAFIVSEGDKLLASLKKAALDILDNLVNKGISKIGEGTLKTLLETYYNSEKKYVNDIVDLETAKEAANKVTNDTKSFILTSLKPFILQNINDVINPLIEKITHNELKTSIQNFYNNEIKKVETVETIEDIVDTFNEIITDTKEFIKTETEKVLVQLKNAAINELDPFVTSLLEKLPNQKLKGDVTTFYNQEKGLLEAVESIDEIETTVAKIKEDLLSFAVIETKKVILSTLDNIINMGLAKVDDEEIRSSINTYYNQEKTFINNISDIDTAKEAFDQIIEDTKDFTITTLKPVLVNKITSVIDPLIEKIPDEAVRKEAEDIELEFINILIDIENMEQMIEAYKEALENTKAEINALVAKLLLESKNKALGELQEYLDLLVDKIPYQSVKDLLSGFYTDEIKKLELVESFDELNAFVIEFKEDLEDYALEKALAFALDKVDEALDAGLELIPIESLKLELQEIVDEELLTLRNCESLDTLPTKLEEVLSNIASAIEDLLTRVVQECLSNLLSIRTVSAYDYLPEAMNPRYTGNLVDLNDITYDFTSFVDISNIKQQGFGEQWHMVVENIEEVYKITKVFDVIQDTVDNVVTLVNTYIENNYDDEITYTNENEIITVYFNVSDSIMTFDIAIKQSVTVPVIGEVQPIINMKYDINEDEREMFVSLGDAFKVRYVVSPKLYELGLTYGITIAGKTGSRTSFLSIENNNSNVEGHIYEFTTFENEDMKIVSADFFVENGYVSVVGNNASGMIHSKNFIFELYDSSTGLMIAYDVKEEGKTQLDSFNTLWFNLWDINGLLNIKTGEKTKHGLVDLREIDVFLNESDNLFIPTYNLGVNRRYDIEYRFRYYVTYDSENNTYIINEVEVPMLFVQEEALETFTLDVLEKNSLDLSINLNQLDLEKILNDYSTLISNFKNNKNLISSEDIISFITGAIVEE